MIKVDKLEEEQRKLAYKKWWYHKANASGKKVKHIDFESYCRKILEAGITPEMIGSGNGKYCLGRIGDVGDYTNTSCRFITHEQNRKEQQVNTGKISSAKNAQIRKDNFSSGKWDNFKEAFVQRTEIYYSFKSPTGKIYQGKNLTAFCRDNNLSIMPMCRLNAGKLQRTRKGWTKY